MDLTSDKIPNKMLLGTELLEVAVTEFRAMLQRDHMFLHTIAYPRVSFSIQATFQFGYPIPPDHKLKSRVQANGVIEGEVPMVDPPEDAEVVSLERDIVLDNPNVARISHDLPIMVQERRPPASPPIGTVPGEETVSGNPFPTIENIPLKYDKTQYPSGPAPVDRDVSEQKAKELGMKTRRK